MLDLIHPASNDILLAIYRGGPADEKEWAAVRRSAVTLAESGNLLMLPGRARDQAEWSKDVKMLVDAGNAAYQAALSKDVKALAAVAQPLDASCTTCHKQYRPNVFPAAGRIEMIYSRRNFLKAAGSGVALTALGSEGVFLAAAAPLALGTPMTSEKSTFLINGKPHVAEYEARTTLWEVIAIKSGLTGTNRSCNRASCGACSVLVDGTPLYSCHTLATEAVGKKILTIEGVGDEKNLHPLQRIGHTRVAADCGFCTAGWVVTAKGLLDKNPSPSEDQVKSALAGHICRCAAYPNIIRAVMDSAAVLRGSTGANPTRSRNRSFGSRCPWSGIIPPHGGHFAGDEIMEGTLKTKKWQGYPPENLNVLGQPIPALPEVMIPRFTGKAQYASRVWFPNMLYVKFLTCPHPHARITNIDTSAAEKMPGVVQILTYKNAPKPANLTPGGVRAVPEALPRELNLQGETVAIVAAETEDLAEDAVAAIKVDYEVLPFASRLEDAMAPDAPDLWGPAGASRGVVRDPERRNLLRHANSPKDFPHATWADQRGDIEKGFAQADVIKEFTYHFSGGVSVPMQPSGSVAKWDGDQLTFWGMGQGIYPPRAGLAAALGIDPSKIRFINKWNGSTFGAARAAAERFYPLIAHIAKETGRPVKVMLPKDQELAQLVIKPETITKFRVGLNKDGHITAIDHEVNVSVGELEFGNHADGPGNAAFQLELYTSQVPHWRSTWCCYRTNAPRPGPSRSHLQQETKWSWENMMDEMAEAAGLDPVQFRLMHITRPNPRFASSLRFVRVRGSVARGRQGLRMGEEKSGAGRRAGAIQARLRPRNVAASRRPDGLSRRRGAFREISGRAGRECFWHRARVDRRRLREHENRASR